jgi:hypothetical protein
MTTCRGSVTVRITSASTQADRQIAWKIDGDPLAALIAAPRVASSNRMLRARSPCVMSVSMNVSLCVPRCQVSFRIASSGSWPRMASLVLAIPIMKTRMPLSCQSLRREASWVRALSERRWTSSILIRSNSRSLGSTAFAVRPTPSSAPRTVKMLCALVWARALKERIRLGSNPAASSVRSATVDLPLPDGPTSVTCFPGVASDPLSRCASAGAT